MLSVRKVLAAVAIVIVAAVGGFALAHAVTTDGPDPKVDEPVVVRPAGNSDDDKSKSEGPRKDDNGKNDNRKNTTKRDGMSGGGDRDDRGSADDRDDQLTPVNPTPRTFDDDDDDDDGGDDDDDGDDGGDD